MKLELIVSSRSDLQRHHKVWNGNAGEKTVYWQTSREFAMFGTKKLNFYIYIFYEIHIEFTLPNAWNEFENQANQSYLLVRNLSCIIYL